MSRARCLTPLTALVPGGAGFVGRHAVAALKRRGWRVVVGTRNPATAGRRLSGPGARCERRALHLEQLLSPSDWNAALEGIDVVLNCVGILRPRGAATYERVQHLAPAALAAACQARGLRLVHVSALGLAAAHRSGFLTSKRAGERAVLDACSGAIVVRAPLLDGEGGYGARWLRRVANWPLHPVPAGADGRIAAMQATDLGECLAALCAPACRPGGPVVELGGPHALTLSGLLYALRTRPGRARTVRVPSWLARALSHLCDGVHWTPFSFGHFELLRRDNAPSVDAAPALLGRAAAPVGAATPTATGIPRASA